MLKCPGKFRLAQRRCAVFQDVRGIPASRTGLLRMMLIAAFFQPLLADNHQNSSFQFLNSIYSPRLRALGGSFASFRGDLNGILVNPAGVAFIENRQLEAMYVDHLLDLKGGFAGISFPVRGWGSISAGIIYFDHGRFEEVDRFATLTGRTFEAQDFAFLTTVSGYLNPHFAYGLTLKYAYSRLDEYSASALAVDLGILFRMGVWGGLDIGIALRNLGKSLDAYYQIRESLPTSMAAGFSQRLAETPFTLHAGLNNLWNRRGGLANNFYNFSFGLETSLSELLILRVGYNNDLRFNIESSSPQDLAGFSGGFALKLGAHQLEYGYGSYTQLGGTHHFGLKFILDQNVKPKVSQKPSKPAGTHSPFPPQHVTFEIVSQNLRVSWDKIRNASYNVYVKLLEKTEWVLINKIPLRRNFISLKKPRVAGTYVFSITSLSGEKESFFSEPLMVKIGSIPGGSLPQKQ